MYLPYEKQWSISDAAQALGWAGYRPGVLGTFSSNKSLEEAVTFLESEKALRFMKGEPVEILPAIPCHSHSIGVDGVPTCGCSIQGVLIYRDR